MLFTTNVRFQLVTGFGSNFIFAAWHAGTLISRVRATEAPMLPSKDPR